MELVPRLIFWEINQKCNLSCAYCRRNGFSAGGLSIEKYLYVIDSITKKYKPLLVFSGGEPLLNPHIFKIASYAKKKGLNTALATNATLIDDNLAKKIKAAEFHRVAISLDGANAATNDALRGKGAFLKAMKGIMRLQSEDVELQINTTILRKNFKELSKMFQLCLSLNIKALHIFAFVPVGCGVAVSPEERLSAEEYESLLNEIADFSLKSKLEIKLTCAPHYQRILLEKDPHSLQKKALFKGCLAGTGICFISAEGTVFPCGYLMLSAGNIFKEEFGDIWQSSQLFITLRKNELLKGRCGICEYVDLCGGCRARAYADTGDYLTEEPECNYQPIRLRPGLIVSDRLVTHE